MSLKVLGSLEWQCKDAHSQKSGANEFIFVGMLDLHQDSGGLEAPPPARPEFVAISPLIIDRF